MEDLIKQFKNNRIVRYAILVIFLLLAYMFSGFAAIITGIIGLILGRLSYNDVVDELEV